MTASPAPVRYCEGCGKQASGDARFCGACGRPFGGGQAGSDRGSGPARSVPGGKPVAAGATGVPGATTTAAGTETEVFTFRPLAVQTLAQCLLCVLTLGIAWVFLWVRRSHTRFMITTHRIEIRTGIVSVLRRSVDLYRIQDLEVREPFFLRMRGAGEIVVRSLDPGDPEVTLEAVANVQEVHETLRRLVADERRRQGVRLIEEQS